MRSADWVGTATAAAAPVQKSEQRLKKSEALAAPRASSFLAMKKQLRGPLDAKRKTRGLGGVLDRSASDVPTGRAAVWRLRVKMVLLPLSY